MGRPPEPLTDRDRVLIVRLGAVGDVLRTLPALHLLRTTFPRIHLAWIVEDLSRSLLEGHPEIDDVILLPRREIARGSAADALRRVAGLRRTLRGRGFTAAIDFQGSLKSALLAVLSGAPRRVGFAPGHSREMSYLLTNDWVRPPLPHLNRVVRNLLLAAHVGASGDDATPVLPEGPDDGFRAEAILGAVGGAGRPVVVISPGTSDRQRFKRWPAAHFARLSMLLAQDGALPLLVWGPGEEQTARAIAAAAGSAHVAPATDLRSLAALLRRVAAFVGADTGPMHLAWIVGCPVVALFGPTDPRLNAPIGDAHAVLSPPAGGPGIPPERVRDAIREILGRATGHARPVAPPRLSRRALYRSAGLEGS